ncbi:MAG: PBP1A family penicillin-binding protein [Alphaproteobacteria bacterium]|nr:PBP1A family penicillin-binding protein [Alphaproteobacteria bacterium]
MGKTQKKSGKGPSDPRGGARRGRKAEGAHVPPQGGILGRIAYTLTLVLVWGTVGLAGLLAFIAKDLPSTEGLIGGANSQTVTFLDLHGKVIARRGRLSQSFVTVEDLPPHVMQAVIASEDRRFRSHFGIDLRGLGRAFWVNMQEGRVVQGGSTITQQLAKNLFLRPDRTMFRKVQEAVLALYLEASFSKDEILSLYLNKVYFGAGAEGIDEAARRYFNKPASQLSLVEAAILAGLLKAPSRYSPANGNDLALSRSRVVLQAMLETGAITQADYSEALRTRPKFAPNLFGKGSVYFVDWVQSQLQDLVGNTDKNIIVETTLDLSLQRQAEEAAMGVLAGPQREALQVAMLAMTPDGALRAMIGGRENGQGLFNRATVARRQPGSAFKPFVYLAALEAGATPETIVIDQPVRYKNWQPENFTPGHEGEMTLSDALAKSVNTVAAQLCLQESPEAVVAVARRLGIVSELPAFPSLALGTAEVTLAELVTAYAPFASGGDGAIMHGVLRIRTQDGEVIYARSGSGMGRVVDPLHVGQMNQMLMQAVRNGTGRQADLGARPAAGKTGTTQAYKDAWFIGYTRQLVAGVWIGSDRGPASGVRITGGTLPAQAWKAFMLRASANQPIMPLPGLDQVAADVPSGIAATPDFDELLGQILKESEPEAGRN